MSATRRIVIAVSHDNLFPAAKDPRRACGRSITLDSKLYLCGREVRRTDRQHDGIHDAFRDHDDGGKVRW